MRRKISIILKFAISILILAVIIFAAEIPAFAKKAKPKAKSAQDNIDASESKSKSKAKSKSKGKKGKAQKPDEADKPASAEAEEPEKPKVALKYTGFDSKRDPFEPPEKIVKSLKKTRAEVGDKPVKLPKIDLQGIIWSSVMPQVIINNKVLKVGDFVDEFEIKEIHKEGLILLHKGQEYKLGTPGIK